MNQLIQPCPHSVRVGEICGMPFYPVRPGARLAYAAMGALLAVAPPLVHSIKSPPPLTDFPLASFVVIALLVLSVLMGLYTGFNEETKNEWRCFFSAFSWPGLAVALAYSAQSALS